MRTNKNDDPRNAASAPALRRPASEWALAMDGVTRRYGRGAKAVHALRGVDVRLAHGSFTAVMGPSGSGKSTLLQCGAGLDRPTGGRVLLGGQDIGRMGERRLTRLRRERVGFVFQSFNLLPALTAEQNVLLPLRLAGRRPHRAEAARLLAEVGLGDRGGSRPGELSGGQQQRVAIARALITGPAVVCADEPTGSLDPATAEEVMGLLRRAVTELGTTVLMVRHDPVAAAWADRVIFLDAGRVADVYDSSGTPTSSAIATRMRQLAARRGPARASGGALADVSGRALAGASGGASADLSGRASARVFGRTSSDASGGASADLSGRASARVFSRTSSDASGHASSRTSALAPVHQAVVTQAGVTA